MSIKNGPCGNEAMDKIIGNMTAEMQKVDGQYVPLGFTPSPPTTSESLNWTSQHDYVSPYGVHNAEPVVGIEQYPPQSYSYMPSASHGYESSSFNKNLEYDVYKTVPNSSTDCLLDYRLLLPQTQVNNIPEHTYVQHPDNVGSSANHTQLIEHLVGNWVVPNNNGTYSPFGNPDAYKLNVFDERDSVNLMRQMKEESKLDGIQFNRDFRKPRMVAEVKPMRPSYSDVLTKPVPQVTSKPLKNESKDSKPRKDNKKLGKGDKEKKSGGLNRSNTNNDIKDLPLEKNQNLTKLEKVKGSKNDQLGRKWASLDNISDPLTKNDDVKKKKDDNASSKNLNKQGVRKLNKTMNDMPNLDSESIKCETFNVMKNCLKKVNKPTTRPKSNDFGNNEKPSGKRNQRTRKRETHVPFGIVGHKLKQYTKGWWKIFIVFVLWLFHLISDICSLSVHIGHDIATNSWTWLGIHWALFLKYSQELINHLKVFSWIKRKFKGRKKAESKEEGPNFVHNGLQHNINMPTTGDEAMKRLLACKDKDPYSILGVTPTCTDDDIKRYYKRQAFLVHPDKNNQPGAEEAFKILVHAFDMIGEPERRASYDRGVVESAQVVQAWSELTELLQQLQRKVEAAANTIRCSACGLRHKRAKIERPSYAARNCGQCRIHHSAREGDIWAEARVFGLRWHYFACMEGSVYDITEWAGCQKDSLKHLRPDSHHVQYRIALGKQNNQPKRHSTTIHTERPDLENLLNTLYGQNDSTQGPRRKNKKTNK